MSKGGGEKAKRKKEKDKTKKIKASEAAIQEDVR